MILSGASQNKGSQQNVFMNKNLSSSVFPATSACDETPCTVHDIQKVFVFIGLTYGMCRLIKAKDTTAYCKAALQIVTNGAALFSSSVSIPIIFAVTATGLALAAHDIYEANFHSSQQINSTHMEDSLQLINDSENRVKEKNLIQVLLKNRIESIYGGICHSRNYLWKFFFEALSFFRIFADQSRTMTYDQACEAVGFSPEDSFSQEEMVKKHKNDIEKFKKRIDTATSKYIKKSLLDSSNRYHEATLFIFKEKCWDVSMLRKSYRIRGKV